MADFAFSSTFSSGDQLPALPRHLTRLHGAFLSLGPFATVTGFAQFTIAGLASAGNSAGGLTINVMPSTTDVVNVPLPFGPYGIEAAAPGNVYPLTVTFYPNGSDVPGNVLISAWGVLEEV